MFKILLSKYLLLCSREVYRLRPECIFLWDRCVGIGARGEEVSGLYTQQCVHHRKPL